MQQKILNNRYELEQKIGEGGMARVYRGRDLRLNRRVAVKVLHNHYASDVGFLRRFHHEAQAAASLRHSNIVDVYDVGQDGDIHYIVMEHVDGSDLKNAILQSAPFPVDHAVAIAADVAEGLDAAHRLGMVHRDIKPQNIIVSPDGQVKITDFGIAKSNLSTALTETGVTFGTADYISPEQARGQAATPQSDIYSLGVTLYEMLTGRLPFNGDSSIAVAMQHVGDDPPFPRMFNPRIPPQLEQLVLRMLSKNPAERPASARELIRMLQAYRSAGEQETVVRPVAPRPRPAIGGVAAATVSPAPGRVPMPPMRSPVGVQPPARRGMDFGGFLLGLLLMGVILGGVWLFASGAFNDLLSVVPNGTQPIRPPVNATQAAATATTTAGPPELTPTIEPTIQPMAQMPNLLGMTRQSAISAIQEVGLFPQEDAPRYNDTISPSLVFDQFPRAGTTISSTSVVTYVLSLGPAAVPVPDVSGYRAADAQQLLQQAGFQVRLVEEPSQRMSPGYVIRTEPQAPARPPRGETITVFVSIGNKVRMPEVVGLPEAEARKRISAVGLFVSYIDYQNCDKLGDLCNRYGPGVIVSSTIRAGDLVERDSPVTLGARVP